MINLPFALLFIFGVFISSASQIVLKKTAVKKHDNKLKEYLNFPVIFSYAVFFSATIINVIALRYIPLSMGAIFEASGYVFVTILSYIFLKEKISKKKFTGMVLIILGTVLFVI